jgi:hypothetical protein
MGKPSDQRRSARRPGKRERGRVKTRRRQQCWLNVGGVARAHVKAGRKKHEKVYGFVNRFIEAHLAGESTPKSAVSIERPLYKIEISPSSSLTIEPLEMR